MNLLQSEIMERIKGGEFSTIKRDLDAIVSGAGLPFYLNGNPTNRAVFDRLNRVEQFLHLIAVEVSAELPMCLRYPYVTDPFFGDRIKVRAEEILDRNIQEEVWAF